ncbi:MAG: hypothetical protein ABR955_03000 [Verrucomicrobiota bacterium]|jgi:hypothetical protein
MNWNLFQIHYGCALFLQWKLVLQTTLGLESSDNLDRCQRQWGEHPMDFKMNHAMRSRAYEMSCVKLSLIPDIMKFILHTACHWEPTEMQAVAGAVMRVSFAKLQF